MNTITYSSDTYHFFLIFFFVFYKYKNKKNYSMKILQFERVYHPFYITVFLIN